MCGTDSYNELKCSRDSPIPLTNSNEGKAENEPSICQQTDAEFTTVASHDEDAPAWFGVEGFEAAKQSWLLSQVKYPEGLPLVLSRFVQRNKETLQRITDVGQYKNDEGSQLSTEDAILVELSLLMLDRTLGELAQGIETVPEVLLTALKDIACQDTMKGKAKSEAEPFEDFLQKWRREDVEVFDRPIYIFHHLQLYRRTSMGDGGSGDIAVMKHIQDTVDRCGFASHCSAVSPAIDEPAADIHPTSNFDAAAPFSAAENAMSEATANEKSVE